MKINTVIHNPYSLPLWCWVWHDMSDPAGCASYLMRLSLFGIGGGLNLSNRSRCTKDPNQKFIKKKVSNFKKKQKRSFTFRVNIIETPQLLLPILEMLTCLPTILARQLVPPLLTRPGILWVFVWLWSKSAKIIQEYLCRNTGTTSMTQCLIHIPQQSLNMNSQKNIESMPHRLIGGAKDRHGPWVHRMHSAQTESLQLYNIIITYTLLKLYEIVCLRLHICVYKYMYMHEWSKMYMVCAATH